MTHKLCGVIPGPTYAQVKQQMVQAADMADILELRIDLFTEITLGQLLELRASSRLPVLFTLRSWAHGGRFTGSPEQYLALLKDLACLQPDYLDVEDHVTSLQFQELQATYPAMQLICSAHLQEHFIEEVKERYQTMRQRPAHLYKIVTIAKSTLHALQMLCFVQERTRAGEHVIGICQDDAGQVSRILGPVFGNQIIYASIDSTAGVAPGQLDLHSLHALYGIDRLHSGTRLLGLIGDPVVQSISHMTHNGLIGELGLDAVYVKMRVTPEELPEFLLLAAKLGFHGLSVTMPLKEKLKPFLSEGDFEMDAFNTLTLTPKGYRGDNTDGPAAVALLKERIQLHGKRIVLLGAGGVSRAIAYALRNEEVELKILNRTLSKAQELANACGGEAASLDDFPAIAARGYDILINCTSVGMFEEASPIPLECLLSHRIVFETIYRPNETALMRAAGAKNCEIIDGYALFSRQAAEQFGIWFGFENCVCPLMKLQVAKV